MIDNRKFKLNPVALICCATIPFMFSSLAFAQETAKNEQIEKLTVSAQALKVDTSLQETPKSVSIVTQKDLETHAPQKLDEALRYTSGVVSQPYGADNDTDWLRVRGFEAATYLDNSRLFRDGYYTWLLEPYGFEQIEVVKGSSAVLFGESTPGGAINIVQKKPTFNSKNEVFLEAGNNNPELKEMNKIIIPLAQLIHGTLSMDAIPLLIQQIISIAQLIKRNTAFIPSIKPNLIVAGLALQEFAKIG